MFVYVLGGVGENELLLLSALNVIFESISLILKKNLGKRYVCGMPLRDDVNQEKSAELYE